MRAGLVAAALLLGACTPPAAAGGDGSPLTVVLTARHSRFTPATLEVPVGEAVQFVVRNQDPIDHELIVGDQDVHDRHEGGTEPYHPPRPGEVTVPAGAEAATTFVFDEVGTVVFACHLPGHFAYGMRGEVRVVA